MTPFMPRFTPVALTTAAIVASTALAACTYECRIYSEATQLQGSLVFVPSALAAEDDAAYYRSFGVGRGPTADAGAAPESVGVSDGGLLFFRTVGSPCESSAGCLEFQGQGFTLTMAAPGGAGSPSLEALDASICERIMEPPAGDADAGPELWQPVTRCVSAQGTLDVRHIDLGCDDHDGKDKCVWFQGSLTVDASTDPSSASLQGNVSIADQGIGTDMTCGGLGSAPLGLE